MSWDALDRELDSWLAAQRRATLWWRDDDACADTPALQRLLAMARAHDVPVAIAAIPAQSVRTLADAIAPFGQATIVQHGYAHANQAPAGERGAELGDHRPLGVRLTELANGRLALTQLFGERFCPVLVPPWNRIDAALLPALPSAGLDGVSCFGPRASSQPHAGVQQVNAHVDPIAWRRDRAFIGEASALLRVVDHLRARRLAEVDAAEPTGMLTHHLVFSDAAWEFLDRLFARTRRHPAAAWLDVHALFDGADDVATSCRSA
jgi:hypothetical protein